MLVTVLSIPKYFSNKLVKYINKTIKKLDAAVLELPELTKNEKNNLKKALTWINLNAINRIKYSGLVLIEQYLSGANDVLSSGIFAIKYGTALTIGASLYSFWGVYGIYSTFAKCTVSGMFKLWDFAKGYIPFISSGNPSTQAQPQQIDLKNNASKFFGQWWLDMSQLTEREIIEKLLYFGSTVFCNPGLALYESMIESTLSLIIGSKNLVMSPSIMVPSYIFNSIKTIFDQKPLKFTIENLKGKTGMSLERMALLSMIVWIIGETLIRVGMNPDPSDLFLLPTTYIDPQISRLYYDVVRLIITGKFGG
jgi:hypothetical protein